MPGKRARVSVCSVAVVPRDCCRMGKGAMNEVEGGTRDYDRMMAFVENGTYMWGRG